MKVNSREAPQSEILRICHAAGGVLLASASPQQTTPTSASRPTCRSMRPSFNAFHPRRKAC